MATGGRIYGRSNLPSTMFHHTTAPCCSSQPPLDSSLYLSGSSSSSFLGSSSMVSFEDVNVRAHHLSKNKRSFFQTFEQDDTGDEEYDEYFNQSGKKRRLTVDQLNFLEKSFNLDNKLEPDRKLQLAKDLSLQPRQVAIWFQNRRARWKTKQMEKDYDVLQESFNALKANYDCLFQEKEDLKAQIALLAEEFARKQKGEDMLEASQVAAASISDSEESKVSMVASKQEEYSTIPKMGNGKFDSDSTSTMKDDMFDTDRHYYMNGMHVDMLEPENNSDLSQDEEDSLRRGFLPSTPYTLPKLEEPWDYSFASSSNFAFPAEDNAFWSWSF